jgi:Uma2 family endonuclease
MRKVSLPDEALPATLALNPDLHMSDDEYFDLCIANPDLSLERTAEGEIIIVPPAGGESASGQGYR